MVLLDLPSRRREEPAGSPPWILPPGDGGRRTGERGVLLRCEKPSSPVPRLPLGFEGGGAPFVVGEGFQRGPPFP